MKLNINLQNYPEVLSVYGLYIAMRDMITYEREHCMMSEEDKEKELRESLRIAKQKYKE